MANIELLLNPHINPIYIATNNIVYVVSTLTINEIYTKLSSFANVVYDLIKICLYTVLFITYQLWKEFYEYFYNYPLTNEKFIFIISFISIFTLLSLKKTNKKIKDQTEKINSLEKQIELINLVQIDDYEVLTDDINIFKNQIDIKYSTLNKRTRKIERDLRKLE